MTCPMCRAGTLQSGLADKVLVRNEMTLVVKQTPAMICDICGERFFDAQITQQLLDLAREAENAGVVVDVRRYVAA